MYEGDICILFIHVQRLHIVKYGFKSVFKIKESLIDFQYNLGSFESMHEFLQLACPVLGTDLTVWCLG